MIDDGNDVDVPNFQDEGNVNEPGNAEGIFKNQTGEQNVGEQQNWNVQQNIDERQNLEALETVIALQQRVARAGRQTKQKIYGQCLKLFVLPRKLNLLGNSCLREEECNVGLIMLLVGIWCDLIWTLLYCYTCQSFHTIIL